MSVVLRHRAKPAVKDNEIIATLMLALTSSAALCCCKHAEITRRTEDYTDDRSESGFCMFSTYGSLSLPFALSLSVFAFAPSNSLR